MINKVVLVGRLTKILNIEQRLMELASRLYFAVNRTFTNSNGEREADFINVVTFKSKRQRE